jgi:hypothetical protein
MLIRVRIMIMADKPAKVEKKDKKDKEKKNKISLD